MVFDVWYVKAAIFVAFLMMVSGTVWAQETSVCPVITGPCACLQTRVPTPFGCMSIPAGYGAGPGGQIQATVTVPTPPFWQISPGVKPSPWALEGPGAGVRGPTPGVGVGFNSGMVDGSGF